jgi:hypothetical protein
MSLSGPQRRLTVIVARADQPRLVRAVHDAFHPQLDERVSEGLVVFDEVHVHRCAGRQPTR